MEKVTWDPLHRTNPRRGTLQNNTRKGRGTILPYGHNNMYREGKAAYPKVDGRGVSTPGGPTPPRGGRPHPEQRLPSAAYPGPR